MYDYMYIYSNIHIYIYRYTFCTSVVLQVYTLCIYIYIYTCTHAILPIRYQFDEPFVDHFSFKDWRCSVNLRSEEVVLDPMQGDHGGACE